MQEDKNEIALKLYESVIDLYKFAFRTTISMIAGYMAGSGLLYAFYVQHPTQRILLLLPAFAGIALSIVSFVTAYYTKNFTQMFQGPMQTIKFAVEHEKCSFYVPAHQPLTILLLVIGIFTSCVALQCLYFGEFLPTNKDVPAALALTAILAATITKIVIERTRVIDRVLEHSINALTRSITEALETKLKR